ncbi:MAG: ABC transporter ATP-binding protein [Acidimicrobiales bacterium]
MNTLRSGDVDDDLPPIGRSLRYSMRLAYEAEPRLLVVSFVLITLSWLPDAFGALWLKSLVDAATTHDDGRIRAAAAGLAAAAAAGWVLRTVGSRIENRFRDKATLKIEAHVARLQGSIGGLDHHERPALLDRLQLLREQVFLLNHLYVSLMTSIGSLGRLSITLALLASVHPALLLLGLFAIPTVVVSTQRAAAERSAQERAAPGQRLARHLFELGTTPGPGKEVRVSAIEDNITARRREAWRSWYEPVAAARTVSAVYYAATWTLFALGYIGAVVFVASGLEASAGDVLLVLAAGANLSRYVGATAGETEFLRWTLDASQRLTWLDEYATAHAAGAEAAVPMRLAQGISFEHVSFSYPGTDREVLHDVDISLQAGSVVALVGENGAGKTTLVKLLCRFYDPTSGRITLDGVDLTHIPAEKWRDVLSGAFQDFFRFEYDAQRTIGVGDLERIDDRPAVETAVGRAGANDVIERLPAGVETRLGATWADGVELSIGQWQKLALARGFMRDRPLVCVLDEPTAALDAETEHALFERFATESRAARDDGRITVLVSHRFSTVRMADLIVVLDGNRIAEQGNHEELMARGGLYAELYEVQAAAYR